VDQDQPLDQPGTPEEQRPIDDRMAVPPDGLGLDDATDAERARAGHVPGEEGGLGFDDLSDMERDQLVPPPPNGGLGLDDIMVVPADEDEEERAA
jgi:hypothetical protein